MIITTLSVQAGVNARAAGDIDSVVASLPLSLRYQSPDPDLVAIAGRVGWVQQAVALIDSGVRGLMVIDPALADAVPLADAAARAGVPVALDHCFAGNPLLPALHEHFAAAGDRFALLESRVIALGGANLEWALLDQLAMVRTAVSPVTAAAVQNWTDRGYLLTGTVADGQAVQLTSVCTNAWRPGAELRLIGPAGAVEVAVPHPRTARPATATITTPDGATTLPTLFETGHRAAWRRLRHLVLSRQMCRDVEDFVADAAIVAAAVRPPPDGPAVRPPPAGLRSRQSVVLRR